MLARRMTALEERVAELYRRFKLALLAYCVLAFFIAGALAVNYHQQRAIENDERALQVTARQVCLNTNVLRERIGLRVLNCELPNAQAEP